MKTHQILTGILLVTTFVACDKVKEPYPTPDYGFNVIWDDSASQEENNNGERFVLMEEFTGMKCTNCPAGADVVQNIQNAKGHQFIPMAIHVIDGFSAPGTPNGAPAGSFMSDYRTKEGVIYENLQEFDIVSLPGGMVSRLTERVTSSKWLSQTNSIIGQPAIADIEVTGYYDDSLNAYGARVRVNWLQDVGDSLNLQIQLIEDSIYDWQEDKRQANEYVENYLHRHMFRGSVNGAWGVKTGAGKSGETFEKFYQRLLDPNGKGIKPEHVAIIAFIYADSPSYVVYQVNEAKIMH